MNRRLLFDSEVLAFVGGLKKRDRDFLWERFELIRKFPAAHQDYHVWDEAGRDLDAHVAGRFAIVFWDDATDRHLKVMRVTWADAVE